jgi:hypothetical protein
MEACQHKTTMFSLEPPQRLFTLHTAEEMAALIPMEVSLLLELTDALYVPHLRIANGEPLYRRAEVKKWVKENALVQFDGQSYPPILQVMGNPDDDAKNAPAQLAYIRNVKRLLQCPPGVYFMLNGGKVVYIGQSQHPEVRVKSHTRFPHSEIWILPVPKRHLNDVEGALIRLFNPKYNGRLADGINPMALGDPEKDVEYLAKFAGYDQRFNKLIWEDK